MAVCDCLREVLDEGPERADVSLGHGTRAEAFGESRGLGGGAVRGHGRVKILVSGASSERSARDVEHEERV